MTSSRRHRIEFAAVRGVRAIAGALPDAASRAMGTALGLAFYAADRSHRRLARTQIQSAFPTRTPAECRAIARRTFIHFGRSLVDVLRTDTLSPGQILASVDVEGDDRVRAALAAGKGAIIFSGHFGYWELQGLAHALVLPPMSVLARPLDNPYLHAMLETMRRRTGNQVIYRQGAVRKVLRALSANECVAVLIDQHIHGTDAVTVDFFGRPAATTALLATLALRTGAALIPAFALPQSDGRVRLVYESPVELPTSGVADPVRDLTQRCSDVLEMYVRRYPHLWLWMHRRWRDATPALAAAGMFPAASSDELETGDDD
ncbi:MAG TPA: lysophospholipid acyltransferase family protein [Vicinamibacterales bacterium]|jgi:KDO2-lipid IV(A) lauroyltransferase|nr:lysophospholipid acyltransferase family protein [Vicinamibacterales bacterium]